MSKITPFLWFNANADEAIEFYKSVFKDTKVLMENRYPEGGPAPAGTLITATIELLGQKFSLLNAGPEFKFTEAVSFFIDCTDQAEVDYYWEKLAADGGEEGQCGWLKDKFGLSWQVVPSELGKLLSDSNPAKAGAVMDAMMKIRKIEVAELEKAAKAA